MQSSYERSGTDDVWQAGFCANKDIGREVAFPAMLTLDVCPVLTAVRDTPPLPFRSSKVISMQQDTVREINEVKADAAFGNAPSQDPEQNLKAARFCGPPQISIAQLEVDSLYILCLGPGTEPRNPPSIEASTACRL